MEPAPADALGVTAQIGKLSGGESEFGSEAGDGLNPSVGPGAYAKEDGGEIGIDGSGFIRPGDASGSVDEIEILGCSHWQNAAAAGFGLNGTKPAIGGEGRTGGDVRRKEGGAFDGVIGVRCIE